MEEVQAKKETVATRQAVHTPISRDWLNFGRSIGPRTVTRFSWTMTAFVILLGLLHEFLVHVLAYDGIGESLIDLDAEEALGAWWSSMMFMACAGLLVIAGRRTSDHAKRFTRHWQFLGMVFVCLSIDEVCSVHEGVSNRLNAFLDTAEYFSHSWVIPAAFGVLALGLAYIPFLQALERRYAIFFVLSGGIFISGAIGFETIGGFLDNGSGSFSIEVIFEETLELVGLNLFLASLVRWLSVDAQVPMAC